MLTPGAERVPHPAGSRDARRGTGNNFLRLLRGRGVAALLMLGAMGLMARALSPADFGLVILLHSFVLSAYGLVNLKPFEAVVLYGTRHAGKPERLEQLLRLIALIDLATVIMAFVLAWFAAAGLARLFGWGEAELVLARGYSLIVFASTSGWASGLLRLYGRFDLIANERVVQGSVMLAGAAGAVLFDAGMLTFVVVQGTAFMAQRIYLQYAGWRELRRRHRQAPLVGPVMAGRHRRYPGLGRFLMITYWQGNLDLFPKHLVVLGAGAVLGENAAGLYRLAAQSTRVISAPALLLRQVLFPDLARLWQVEPRQYRGLLRRSLLWSALSAALLVAATLAAGDELLVTAFGERYRAGAGLLVWLMLAAALELISAVLRAALYARSRAASVLFGYASGVLLHVVAFMPLTLVMGLAGAGVAAVLGALLTLAILAGSHFVQQPRESARPGSGSSDPDSSLRRRARTGRDRPATGS